jgi:hemoglobin/transferrin/lactoferrin receptor protein
MLLPLLMALVQDPPVAPEVLITASARDQALLEAPWSAESIGAPNLTGRRRTLMDALQGLPSVMLQRTAHGQVSPFLRGFTGFRTMMLVDGVRLNHAAMREGPNQYWSTVDAFTVERLELVRGPASVLYGSDAIGGTVHAVGRSAELGVAGGGTEFGGRAFARLASAENSATTRVESSVAHDGRWGARAGLTVSDFGDLEAGSGMLPETGYDELDADLRWDGRLAEHLFLTVAAQTARQTDVPRTHTTIFAVPFAGTEVGSDLRRDLDQTRDLVYGRVAWDERGGLADQGTFTLSWQRHAETQDRLRSGDRRDLQGFELEDVGANARFVSEETATGRWSWGVEGHLQTADSFRDNFVAGAFTGSDVQGPIGDDSTYTDLAAYVQDELEFARFTLVPGVRVSWFDLASDRVANPDPGGPPVIGVDESWAAATGSLRALAPLGADAALFAGVSQGFRAPNLSDLTAFDSTSVVETPSPDLEPENFLQFELGTKGERGAFAWQAAAYHTLVDDMIVRSPTGVSIGGTPEVQKSNVGDGWIQGIELSGAWTVAPQWTAFLTGTWMDGEVDDVVLPAGDVVRDAASRLAPLQAYGGLRWQDADGHRWIEGWFWAVNDQDLLALKDVTDTQRIPPGGTPGYTVFGITAGMDLREDVRLIAAVENLGDKDYRVHGSGVNQPGRNLVLAVDFLF